MMNSRKYDQEGKLKDWWTNATSAAFEKKSQCFVNQFNNYTMDIPDHGIEHVNGVLTLGENLADAGGLARSFEAWSKSTPQKNFLLPGLANFTQQQLFFVSFGQVWCGHYRPSTILNRLRTDPHAPANWRVNGAVSNSPEFAQSFGCKADSPMSPKITCSVW
jgi:endothelin-converting enzyme